ncbi:hypothetical protein C2845_PM05G04030 [Panicum miliaceum]|uniref:Uncharacterized protein n=1 Tax=Panicum miliaceum TaxID=4540 RepID=A0A3L6SZB5_PANMI|nr:hypothetical protein C2845_PM05G04030 [Panicum miliaceum]
MSEGYNLQASSKSCHVICGSRMNGCRQRKVPQQVPRRCGLLAIGCREDAGDDPAIPSNIIVFPVAAFNEYANRFL